MTSLVASPFMRGHVLFRDAEQGDRATTAGAIRAAGPGADRARPRGAWARTARVCGRPSRAVAPSRCVVLGLPGTTRQRRARGPAESRVLRAARPARRPRAPRARRSTRRGGSARRRLQILTRISPSSTWTSYVRSLIARSKSFSPVRTSYCHPCQGHVRRQPSRWPSPSGPFRWIHACCVA